uniref:Sialate O-acetylesterase domain-containing protein n=1 Tax=Vitis vinifera TaxID=29760 RepID=F6I2M5_VITVI
MAGRDDVNDHHKWDEVVLPECNPDSSIPRLNAQLHWEFAREPLHADIDTKKACGMGPRMSFTNTVRKRVGWWGWCRARLAAPPSKSGHLDSPCMRTW